MMYVRMLLIQDEFGGFARKTLRGKIINVPEWRRLTGDICRLLTREIRKVRLSGMALVTGGDLAAARKQPLSSIPQSRAEHRLSFLSPFLFLSFGPSRRLSEGDIGSPRNPASGFLSLFCTVTILREPPGSLGATWDFARVSGRGRARARAHTPVIERSDDRRVAVAVHARTGDWFLTMRVQHGARGAENASVTRPKRGYDQGSGRASEG